MRATANSNLSFLDVSPHIDQHNRPLEVFLEPGHFFISDVSVDPSPRARELLDVSVRCHRHIAKGRWHLASVLAGHPESRWAYPFDV